MDKQEKKTVIKAINELGRKVSVADVATKTGLPVLVVASDLNEVAAETKGSLQVSTAGDIVYRFDAGFQNVYLTQGIRRFLEKCFEQIFHFGFLLLRVSFGVFLILSLLIIVILFFVIIFSINKGSEREDDRRNIDFNFDFFDYLILRDLFYWGSYQAYPNQPYSNRARRNSPKKSNFLFNCFSFLFGDGNPNARLKEDRWQYIAQLIRANGGVVTAEQLAPYTDADPKNEDGVLPVLVRFDGRPEVTDSGNIVYLFPSLQISAATAQQSGLPPFLHEKNWFFSQLSAGQLIPVAMLAAVNFFGSWWLFIQATYVSDLSELMPLLVVLVVYGTLFVLVPLVRWLTVNYFNTRINMRNAKREKLVSEMQQADEKLSKKLSEAEHFKTKIKQISTNDVVYTTDKDFLEQQF